MASPLKRQRTQESIQSPSAIMASEPNNELKGKLALITGASGGCVISAFLLDI
jgi:hypothetical protein